MSRTWVVRILAVAATCFAALVAVEVILQVISLAIGLHLATSGPQCVGSPDVVVYGDSTPFGLGNTISFPSELARLSHLTVVNRSRPGLNSSQVVLLLRTDLLTCSPHRILVMAGVNDNWNLESVPPALLGWRDATLQYIARIRLVRLVRLAVYTLQGESPDPPELRIHGWQTRDRTASRYSPDFFAEIARQNFLRIRSMAATHGATLRFIGYQSSGWRGSGDIVDSLLSGEFSDMYIPTRDLFQNHALLQADAFHPTDEGQLLIARRIYADLLAREQAAVP